MTGREPGVEEKSIIYVAGDPDGYPLEYYDRQSQSFQGVIPRLLEQFSQQSGYELVYYPTQGADRREQLAKNLQVDLLSGYEQGESHPAAGRGVPLFRVSYEGQELCYMLYPTQVAPAELTEQLEDYFAALPQQLVSGLLLEQAAAPQTPLGLCGALAGLGLCTAVLAAVLALTIRRGRRRLRQLRQELEQDEVTGLGRLVYLKRCCRQLINDKNRVLYDLLFFYVDTDRLRRLTSGRESEQALQYCAAVLREAAAPTDILARVSEQGFVLVKRSGSLEQARQWSLAVLGKLRAYPQVCHKPFELDLAVGIYPLKMGDRDLDEAIFNASQTAYEAYREGQACGIFSRELQNKIRLEQNLRATVEQALEREEFQLYLQFYVDAHTYRIMGGEALSRWYHPERGLLSPGAFVPMLEREGLICKLDYYCLRCACRFLQTLLERGEEHFFLSCNFSRETFAAPDFAQRCKAIMEEYRFPRELLIFELTESASVRCLGQIRDNMLALKEYGVRIALDDFGEGFTCFADLQQYPVDGIKLDKGLIEYIATKNGNAVVRAMVQAGHELGLTILAEGVEQQAQVQALQQMHCDVIQGFRFHAPMPAAECLDQILARQPGAAPQVRL